VSEQSGTTNALKVIGFGDKKEPRKVTSMFKSFGIFLERKKEVAIFVVTWRLILLNVVVVDAASASAVLMICVGCSFLLSSYTYLKIGISQLYLFIALSPGRHLTCWSRFLCAAFSLLIAESRVVKLLPFGFLFR
jgi:hypothetical protein